MINIEIISLKYIGLSFAFCQNWIENPEFFSLGMDFTNQRLLNSILNYISENELFVEQTMRSISLPILFDISKLRLESSFCHKESVLEVPFDLLISIAREQNSLFDLLRVLTTRRGR